jgi:phage FluMu protein Com
MTIMAVESVERVRCGEENSGFSGCSHDLGVQINNSYLRQKCANCEVIENLRSDSSEYQTILSLVNRQTVKEAIQAEIDVLLVKINSVRVQTFNRPENENWR